MATALLATGCGAASQSPQTSATAATRGEVIEFHIPAETGTGPWNSRDELVTVHVGDTLRFVNDDGVVHALHTAGAPCNHTPDIAPGGTYDCVVRRAYDSLRQGPLFDHYAGPRTSAFWIVATVD
jgi:hypothetical protein